MLISDRKFVYTNQSKAKTRKGHEIKETYSSFVDSQRKVGVLSALVVGDGALHGRGGSRTDIPRTNL